MGESVALNSAQLVIIIPIVAVICIVTSIITAVVRRRSSAIYQKNLCKKLRKVKQAQKAYNKCYDPEKQDKIEKKYNKARKSLEKLIKTLIKSNKNIVIKNPELLKLENLSIKPNEHLTFMGLLNKMVDDYNIKHKKRQVTINAKKQRKVKNKPVIVARSFNEKEISKLNTSAKVNVNEEVVEKSAVQQSMFAMEDEIDLLP